MLRVGVLVDSSVVFTRSVRVVSEVSPDMSLLRERRRAKHQHRPTGAQHAVGELSLGFEYLFGVVVEGDDPRRHHFPGHGQACALLMAGPPRKVGPSGVVVARAGL